MTKETKRKVPSHEETTVAIIGGGVASLTLAIFLQRSGIACVVLERRNRAYIEARQRASFIDWDAVAICMNGGAWQTSFPKGRLPRWFEIRIYLETALEMRSEWPTASNQKRLQILTISPFWSDAEQFKVPSKQPLAAPLHF
jgi:2-polyprenyl-6-methoxyphenol hydroxylase-like FAD-dependent oxidoreductase